VNARPFVIVAAAPEELAEFRRRLVGARRVAAGSVRAWRGTLAGCETVVAVAGDGPARAAERLEQLLAHVDGRAVVGVGVAGGLSRDLAAGDLVVATEVREVGGGCLEPDRGLRQAASAAGARSAVVVAVSGVAATPGRKAALAAPLSGATAVVDLESAAWGAAAAARELPWCVLRVVSDAWDDELPGFLARCERADGSMSRVKVLAGALAVPARIGTLFGLYRGVRGAARILADAWEDMMTGVVSSQAGVATREAV
jgi:adenosylhomocysteine nucleosidase